MAERGTNTECQNDQNAGQHGQIPDQNRRILCRGQHLDGHRGRLLGAVVVKRQIFNRQHVAARRVETHRRLCQRGQVAQLVR